jgi:4-amino-4-deoxy-L-arabinose transferase-like glycosyltransferase
LVGGLVFSLSRGIFHAYYTIQLAPAIAALTGVGLVELWSWRARSWFANLILAPALIGTAWWGFRLLARTPAFVPWLGPLALAGAVVAGLILVLASADAMRSRRLALPAAGIGVLAILAGPTAYSLDTVGRTSAMGAGPIAGPASTKLAGFVVRGGEIPPPAVLEEYFSGQGFPGGPPPGPDGDGPGPPRNQVDSTLTRYLMDHQGSATWIVAVNGAGQAAGIELATGKPVMAMGGFLGSDPAPSLDQFQALVRAGKLRYVLIGGRGGVVVVRGPGGPGGPGGPSGDNSNAQRISSWVTAHGLQVSEVGNGNLYDLAGATD